ncbi:helix-turn-helix domain-containing protein [Methylorubrum rhodesianum]|uniref:helix-turn-helix domain-containing protein n=1 Tax=Methylorubrum rhodesianum TaxID=29427 RepID=UPI003D064B38
MPPDSRQLERSSAVFSVITGVQVRAARAMLGWSIDELSLKTGLSANTIKRVEADDQSRPSSRSTITKVKEVLEGEGVLFIGHGAAAPGVQLVRKLG